MQRKLETRSKKCKPQVQVASNLPNLHSQLETCNFFFPAFTLTELLVVIGIIAILIGILLPVAGKIRRAAYTADTQNEISQIANACNQYYSTFHAYPGPLSNDYIEGVNAPTPGTIANPTAHPLEQYVPNGSAKSLGSYAISGTQNLVLGLMGGLRLDTSKTDSSTSPTTSYVLEIAPTEVGLGPLNLSASFPGRTPSFFSAGSNYLMWCEQPSGGGPIFQTTSYQAADAKGNAYTLQPFTDQAQVSAGDSPIPVFVDRFPSPGPMPILYLRARVGACGAVSDGVSTDPINGSTIVLYQYDIRDIGAYNCPNANGTTIGLPPPSNGSRYYHNLWDLGHVQWPLATPGQPNNFSSTIVPAGALNPNPGPKQTISVQPNGSIADAFSYFVNAAVPPTNIYLPNYTARPRAVDQFILISAGPDGIYGTSDDITSFGDVSQ
jgi:type II secretory pathway pseudopilin PulG